MDLTPIRVRGARPNRKRHGAEDFASSLKPRKRPVKTVKPQIAERSVLDNKNARRRLSRIEQLPNELIQNIFTYCDNINLALSSPFIAQQLSGDKIFYQCALRLLYCAPRTSYGRCIRSSAPSNNDLYALLQRRWMSWSMFQRVVLGAHELAVQDSTSASNTLEGDSMPSVIGGPEPPPMSEAEFIAQMRPDFAHPEGRPYLGYIHFQTGILEPAMQMPEKLLRGPWSADDVQFLYYLLWQGVGIDWSYSTLGEVAAGGLSRAIADGQRTVVASLMSRGVGVQPTMDMLRMAIVQHGCDKTIVFYLVCAAVRSVIESRGQRRSDTSATDVNFRDPSIWSFAGRASYDTGRWLKDLLRVAADVASARSHFCEEEFEDLRAVCGRASDDVELIAIPV